MSLKARRKTRPLSTRSARVTMPGPPPARGQAAAASDATWGTVPLPEDDLCVDFYRCFYVDLRDLTASEAARHWRIFGHAENRFPNAIQLIETFKSRGCLLPTDFDAAFYRLLNPQLLPLAESEVDAQAHYLGIGRDLGLAYRPKDAAFVRELYLDDDSPYSRNLRAGVLKSTETLFESAADLLASAEITGQGILSAFNTTDYIVFHSDLGLRRKAQCLHHFVTKGLADGAPISFDMVFDAAFYRDTNRNLLELSDIESYRHWLNLGLARDESPNHAKFLSKLLFHSTDRYPTGFNPALYEAANPDLANIIVGRWRLLQHCLLNGIAEGRGGIRPSHSNADLFRAAADLQSISGHLSAAKLIYQVTLRADPDHVTARRHYADCLFRLNDWHGAAAEYNGLIQSGLDTVWTFLNLASCLVEIREWPQAAAVMRALADQRPGDLGVQRRLREICRSGYDTLRAQALWHGENGFEDEARSTITQAMTLIRLMVTTADRLEDVPQQEIRSVAIVADLGLNQCRFYRVEQKREQLQELGIETTVFDFHSETAEFIRRLDAFDAVILYRVTATPDVLEAIDAIRAAGKPSFYEIDDLMFDETRFPDSFESYGGQISRSLYATLVIAPPQLRTAMALCDFAIASTPALARQMETVMGEGRVFVHHNAMHSPHEALLRHPPHRGTEDRIRIVYGSGTAAHNEDFDLFAAPALLRILRQNPKVDLLIIGYLTLPSAFAAFRSRITRIDPIWDITLYWQVLGTADINIAVLKPGLVADCKSEIKWLEAALLGIPTVATPTETYRHVIEDGRTGLLAAEADAWHKALTRLVADPGLRRAIGRAAQDDVLGRYTRGPMAQKLGRIIGHRADNTQMAPRRKRILLVNVYFPPQAIGGATRVVADNLRDLQLLFGDSLEIEVFSGMEGGLQAHRSSTSLWHGIPVHSVTTPDDPDIDRRIRDDKMVAAFAACVDRFQPDVIHFHCLQRLTAAICEVPLRRGIPYVITAHDGWWISDHQFLVDESGALSLYDYRNPLQEAAKHGAERLARMQLFRHVIDGAAEFLTVSAPFAALYERTGLRRPRVIENGLAPIAFQPRNPSPSGRVRLAHIGGMGLHKGYPLAQAALIDGLFEHLEMLVIDHAMLPGQENTTTWGRTPVTFRGKTAQSRIAELYRNVDVLLAPSVWPESFGLVVREALQAGCWVVVSNRGAISADVTPGCGFVISADRFEHLRDTLRKIDMNPARYLGPLEETPPLRCSQDQARALAALYLGLVGQPQRSGEARVMSAANGQAA